MHVLHITSSALSAYYINHPHFSPAKYRPANIRLFFYLQRKFQQNRHHVVPHPHPCLRPPLPRGGVALPADGRHPLHCGANDATPPLRTRSVPAPSVHRLFNGFLSEGGRRGYGARTEGRPGLKIGAALPHGKPVRAAVVSRGCEPTVSPQGGSR